MRLLLSLMLVCSAGLQAQPPIDLRQLATVPLTYRVPLKPSATGIRCDGLLLDSEWKAAPWTTLFTDIEGDIRPAPTHPTRVRMLWDREALYVAAELTEPDIWATLKERDDIIYRDNDFEVFISGDPTDEEYYELEVNALGTIFDLLLPRPYRDGGKPDIPWNMPGLECGIKVNGTLNRADDVDRGWTVEMRIPFQDLKLDNRGKAPEPGSVWRINFSRVEYDVVRSGTTYRKRQGPDGKDLPEHNWVWSPQGIIDMHFPERWGYLVFEKNADQAIANDPSALREEQMRRCLWMVYYAQRRSYRESKTYFENLPVWAGTEISKATPGGTRLQLASDGSTWSARLTETSGASPLTLSIDQNGIIKPLKP